jgi:hypothetical protein
MRKNRKGTNIGRKRGVMKKEKEKHKDKIVGKMMGGKNRI